MALPLSFAGFDFVDFGCGAGGSIEFGLRKLNGVCGIGFDIDPTKVSAVHSKGYQAVIFDLTKTSQFPSGEVRFALLFNIIEYLESVEAAAICIRSAVKISSEFVFIRQAFFDADQYLARNKVKLYWSDWSAHRNKLRSYDLFQICDRLLFEGEIRRFILFCRGAITSSDDPSILPIEASRNQHGWDSSKHGSKPRFTFTMSVYREIGAILLIEGCDPNQELKMFLRNCVIIYDSIVSPFTK